MTPAGTGETLFPNIPLNAWRPVWSPDGTRLAFQRFVSPESDISIINADGTGLIKTVDNAAGFRKPMSWSPTGRQIAFIGTLNPADPNAVQTINIVNVDGSGSYKLPGSPGFLNSVDWSPDGNNFLYSSGAVISVINADGTGITQLTTVQMTDDGPTTDSEPHWSPDGTRIIFTRSTTNSHAIYTMNADGTNAAKLFNFGGQQADWSADGLSVVFQQGNEICTAKLDGTDFKCVTNNIYYEFDPHWQELPNANPTPTPTPTSQSNLRTLISSKPAIPGGMVTTRSSTRAPAGSPKGCARGSSSPSLRSWLDERIPVVRQNRAVALSHYACAPLALVPLLIPEINADHLGLLDAPPRKATPNRAVERAAAWTAAPPGLAATLTGYIAQTRLSLRAGILAMTTPTMAVARCRMLSAQFRLRKSQS